MAGFEILICKSDMKFNCAHFIAFKGFRERLHGHNYTLAVKITGDETIGPDGYLLDFGDIKIASRNLCKSLNEYFICPMNSDAIEITENTTNLCLQCEDGTNFSFPKSDCAMLPLVHSSAEELCHYLWFQLVRRLGIDSLHKRGIKILEVSVAEAPGQSAIYRNSLPASEVPGIPINCLVNHFSLTQLCN